jgi:hypothetical protein
MAGSRAEAIESSWPGTRERARPLRQSSGARIGFLLALQKADHVGGHLSSNGNALLDMLRAAELEFADQDPAAGALAPCHEAVMQSPRSQVPPGAWWSRVCLTRSAFSPNCRPMFASVSPCSRSSRIALLRSFHTCDGSVVTSASHVPATPLAEESSSSHDPCPSPFGGTHVMPTLFLIRCGRGLCGFRSAEAHLRNQTLPVRLGACLAVHLDQRPAFGIPSASHAATGEPTAPRRPSPWLPAPEDISNRIASGT